MRTLALLALVALGSSLSRAADAQTLASDVSSGMDSDAQMLAAAPPGEPEAPIELSLEELRALGLDSTGDGDVDALDTDVHLSGFMDATVQGIVGEPTAAALVFGDEVSFFVGSLNLYLRKNLTETVRTMAEVRFTYLPNGYGTIPGQSTAWNTQTLDYAGVNETLRWGGIEIERAYVEWTPLSWLGIRLGQFLTPYGIWNIDHGSPVFIPTSRPYAVSGQFFPERQTGLELFGRWDALMNVSLGYHLTLSNGTGPISEYRDLDANKALGGRAFVELRALGTLQLGASAYFGRDSDADVGTRLKSDNSITLSKKYTSQADVVAYGFDLLWKYEGFHLQAEWVGQQLRYIDPARPILVTAGQLGVPANALAADSFQWGAYGLVGYRLPWLGIMPFATLEHDLQNLYGLYTEGTFSQLGLNIRPISQVVLKLEYITSLTASKVTGRTRVVQGQVAWAF